jgi:hypothetical protein
MKSKSCAFVALALAAAVAACEKKSPAEPTAQPTRFVFNATLTSANEVPPIANAEAGAAGTATITMTVTRDGAGEITGGTIDFQVNLTNFPVSATPTIAHIHEAAAGSNGPIRVNTGLAAGQVTIAANGTGSFTRSIPSGTAWDANIARALIANPAGFYFNVHTSLNPGGVVRGQMSLTSSS